tara:strand:- start:15230 stop:16351 length:1122 start_codon:yes stop_codon:yes gene_type:complete
MNKLIKNIIFSFIQSRIFIHYNKKIKNINPFIFKTIKRNKKNELVHLKKWKLLKKKINLKWYYLYSSIIDSNNPDFIPEDIYYGIVEKTLNNSKFNLSYADKNNLNKIVNSDMLCHIFVRNIDGVFYDNNYNMISVNNSNLFGFLKDNDKVIIKKSFDSAGGRSLNLFFKKNHKYLSKEKVTLSIDYLNKIYLKNYLIQEYIIQHAYYEKFNQSSVNTVRVMTYRSVKNEKVNILHSVLRFGAENKFVDNQASGGFSCGIDKNGLLNDFYIDKNCKKYDIKKVLNDYRGNEIVYKFDEIIRKSKSLAKLFPYHRIIGFDFCVDIDGNIKLIEINNNSIEINFIQISCGPLFGEFTDEIIDYCLKNNPTFTINN